MKFSIEMHNLTVEICVKYEYINLFSSLRPGGIFGALLLTLLVVVIVYLLVKEEVKKTTFYNEASRLYGYVPNLPLTSNARGFVSRHLNWR